MPFEAGKFQGILYIQWKNSVIWLRPFSVDKSKFPLDNFLRYYEKNQLILGPFKKGNKNIRSLT